MTHPDTQPSRPVALNGDLRNLPTALAPLLELPNWVVWRWEWTVNRQGRGKWTKPPFQARSPNQYARNNDPKTWASYADALAAYESDQADGIGFNLSNTNFAAFDIDKCRDEVLGSIKDEALAIVENANSYTEITTSGTGLRVLGFGNGTKVHCKQKLPNSTVEVESYASAERYIVVTGSPLPGTWPQLADISSYMLKLVADLGQGADFFTKTKQQQEDTSSDNVRDFYRAKAASLPEELRNLVEKGPAPHADLSQEFHHAVCWLNDRGWNATQIEGYVAGRPITPARYAKRLAGEIARCLAKAKPKNEERRSEYKSDEQPQQQPLLSATPWSWRDPAEIPHREWLYGYHLIRRFGSATIAHPGVGKSALVLGEALALASGRDLLGVRPRERCRVWYWNGEDPQEETDRRIAAACIQFGLKREDLEGWLFTDSGREQEIVIARQTRDGAMIAEPIVNALLDTIKKNSIDAVMIDPFISSHRVTENDNNAIDLVAKRWTKIADAANCALNLVHHSRKTGGAEVTVEDGRGAVALLAAVRSARVLNVMTKAEGAEVGITVNRAYFRVENGKSNLSPPPEGATWFHINSVTLGNGDPNNLLDQGDSVGVVTAWQWPDLTEGVTGADFDKVVRVIRRKSWRENPQSPEWVGRAVAEALGMVIDTPRDKAKVVKLVKMWIGAGSLRVVDGTDAKGMARKFVEVSDAIDD